MDDPSSYSKCHMVQGKDAVVFMSSVIKNMNTSQSDEDILMDIGCGSGDTTRNIILAAFPKVKKIIAVDMSPQMIKFAKENNSNEKIEYYVANIGKRTTIQKWEGTISKLISIHCLHWLKDPRDGFRNIYNLLKPGGEAALAFALTARHWYTFEDLINNPKWNKYLKNSDYLAPESHCKKLRANNIRSMLEELDFKVILCEEDEKAHLYNNSQEMADQIYPVYGLSLKVPKEFVSEFKKDMAEAIIKCNGYSPDGRPLLQYTFIHILVQKPTDINCTN